MPDLKDELDPAVRDSRAAGVARARGVQLAAQRERLSARLPGGLAARRCDAAPLRGLLRRRARSGRRCARPSADARAFPALLCRRQPRALRARPAHVRRPPAFLRQYALDARRRRARHGRARRRATRRKSMASGFRSTMRSAGSKGSTSPIIARCGGCSPASIAISERRC